MHLQIFQVKVSKILDIYRMTHDRARRRRKVVTLEGLDICLDAWMMIHKVSCHMLERYKAKAKAEVQAAPHGNTNRMKTRPTTIQAIKTLRLLLEASVDHIPHLSRTLPNREKVCLKVLPIGTEWKQLLASVNEVRTTHLVALQNPRLVIRRHNRGVASLMNEN